MHIGRSLVHLARVVTSVPPSVNCDGGENHVDEKCHHETPVENGADHIVPRHINHDGPVVRC